MLQYKYIFSINSKLEYT